MNFSRIFYEFFVNMAQEIRPIRFNSIKRRQRIEPLTANKLKVGFNSFKSSVFLTFIN